MSKLTIAQAVKQGADILAAFSTSPRLDSEILMGAVIGQTRTHLIAHSDDELEDQEVLRHREYIARRRKREPVAYITGNKEFWGIEILVSPAVLIPRPDSEILVERAVQVALEKASPVKVLELGAGSGALSIALASELAKHSHPAEFDLVDISEDALKICKQNLLRQNFIDGWAIHVGSWFDPVIKLQKFFDLVIANPPYIALDDTNLSPDTIYEPRLALYSGIDGLDAYRQILGSLSTVLADDGVFLGEIGSTQQAPLTCLWADLTAVSKLPKSTIRFWKDFAGNDRVFELTLSQ